MEATEYIVKILRGLLDKEIFGLRVSISGVACWIEAKIHGVFIHVS